MQLQRPSSVEYGDYFGRYVDLVPDGDVLDALDRQLETTCARLAGLDDARGNFRYAAGKWSLKEVVGHLLDCERVFVYRAACSARGDQTPQPGFEQDEYVEAAGFDERTLEDLVEEFALIRACSLAFFRSLEGDAWTRPGNAAGTNLTARAVPWILAGHELHHMRVIEERYLSV